MMLAVTDRATPPLGHSLQFAKRKALPAPNGIEPVPFSASW
jgi:hypothetical protein